MLLVCDGRAEAREESENVDEINERKGIRGPTLEEGSLNPEGSSDRLH